jgi:citrate lyase subunit beta/citryl-CoA lyase
MKRRSWYLLEHCDHENWQSAMTSGADCIVLLATDKNMQTRVEDVLSSASEEADCLRPALYLQVETDRIDEVADLIAAAVATGISGVMLSSPETAADIQKLDVMLSVAEAKAGRALGKTQIVAMIGDNAAGILSTRNLAGCSSRLSALSWNMSKILEATGAGAESRLVQTVQSLTVLAASACKIIAIDTAHHTQDMDVFRAMCEKAKAEGFSGKIAVSRPQLDIINAVFQR